MKSLNSLQIVALLVVGSLFLQQTGTVDFKSFLNRGSADNANEVNPSSASLSADTPLEKNEENLTTTGEEAYSNLISLLSQLTKSEGESPNDVGIEKVVNVRDFYSTFADMVVRDKGLVFNNSSSFRNYNKIALHLAFKNTPNPSPEILSSIETEIDSLLQKEAEISLQPSDSLDLEKVYRVLNNISWSASEALSKIK